jgi:uncharacterized membrane protein
VCTPSARLSEPNAAGAGPLRHYLLSGFIVNFSTTLLLILAFIAANLPFLVERIFFVVQPKTGAKNVAWRLLELVVLFFVVGGIGLLLEGKLGDIHKQNWEFYAVNAALFVVFAYPGFVYRYLWRRRGG